MTTVKEIQKAVLLLPKSDLDIFRSWFEKYEQKVWDRQIEGDVQGGKLDSFAEQALLDLKEGRCTTL